MVALVLRRIVKCWRSIGLRLIKVGQDGEIGERLAMLCAFLFGMLVFATL